MSYIQDAIIESNALEDEEILKSKRAKKNPPQLKLRKLKEGAGVGSMFTSTGYSEPYLSDDDEDWTTPEDWSASSLDDDYSPYYVNDDYDAYVAESKKSRSRKPELKEEKVEEPVKEEPIMEDTAPNGFVDIEQYLPEKSFVESFVPLKESYKRLNRMFGEHKKGSPIYESNEKRRQREADYRKCANISESFVIMEDNINDWALKRTCMWHNCSPEKLKAELLKKPYTGLERYYED